MENSKHLRECLEQKLLPRVRKRKLDQSPVGQTDEMSRVTVRSLRPRSSARVNLPVSSPLSEDYDRLLLPPSKELQTWHHNIGAKTTNNSDPTLNDEEEHPFAGSLGTDGTAKNSGRRLKPAVAAIFIHAGAGYHSTANQRIHLDACCDAAKSAMKLLKAGRPALDGVEMALKVLEDKEITNAGYGSNLAIDGTVECDATIVDHMGRSGACGAVPNIKNPISLAKVILESSSQPLSLRRVPPNLLVGEGAKAFAFDHNIPLVPNEYLVSRNAQDRFIRWQEDLRRAEAMTPSSKSEQIMATGSEFAQRDHTNAILTGTWNEGQPDSPAAPGTPSENGSPAGSTTQLMKPRTSLSSGPLSPRLTGGSTDRSPLSFLGSLSPQRSSHPPGPGRSCSPASKRRKHCESASDHGNSDGIQDYGYDVEAEARTCNVPESREDEELGQLAQESDEDKITDTVGAIAIDQNGYMAAASSSGGIGMKHRGRIGPAALVGIGTAVIPADESDPDLVVVGAVTSGTGEHMATTMASQKCAERLYHGTRRGKGGADVKEANESLIMENFILHDFQDHPGVRNSSSSSAIGAMAVKKTPSGYYLYFAHNTDSFALASMGSNDRHPHCVMSRLAKDGKGVAIGARKLNV